MTKSKTTKRALLLSVLSMMLCMAMLVGSTFAWFTDSVTSGKNRIVAGNLDVELYYNNASTNDWTDASAASVAEPNFFVDTNGEAILWEPGVMAVTQFKVANVGTLALKYKLETLKADFNALNGHDLSEVIKFAVVEGDKTYDSRDSVLADDLTFDDFTSFSAEGWLLPKDVTDENYPEASDEKIFTVVAYWAPGAEDNLYNVNNGQLTSDNAKQLYIDIEIKLIAAQYTYEEDSFNDQYDKNAEWPEIEVAEDNKAWYKAEESSYTIKNGNELAYLATLVNDGTENFAGKTISLANDIELPVGGWVAIGTYENPFKGTFNGNGHTVSNIVINDNNGNEPTGFFGAANGAVIENLKVSGTMTLAAVQSHESVGGAYAEFFGNGGICGYANKSTIKKCTNDIDIDATARNAAGEAGLSIGGIVGCGVSTTIENCLNEGDIKVSESVPTMAGGITSLAGGMNSMTYATVKNCVNAGSNNGTNGAATEESLDFSGSIVALGIKGSIVNCYSVNGQNVIGMDAEVGTPVTEGYVDNATSLSDFANLDGQVWEFGSNGYPVIK